jgi:hypothetical protein
VSVASLAAVRIRPPKCKAYATGGRRSHVSRASLSPADRQMLQGPVHILPLCPSVALRGSVRCAQLAPSGCDAHRADAESRQNRGENGQPTSRAGGSGRGCRADGRAAGFRQTFAGAGFAAQRLGLRAVETAGVVGAARAVSRFAEAGGRTETQRRAVGRREAERAARPVDVERLVVSRGAETARRPGLRLCRSNQHKQKHCYDSDPRHGHHPCRVSMDVAPVNLRTLSSVCLCVLRGHFRLRRSASSRPVSAAE